jgi:hypothetical protein
MVSVTRGLLPFRVLVFSVGTMMRPTKPSMPSICTLRSRVWRTERSLLLATRSTNQFMPSRNIGRSVAGSKVSVCSSLDFSPALPLRVSARAWVETPMTSCGFSTALRASVPRFSVFGDCSPPDSPCSLVLSLMLAILQPARSAEGAISCVRSSS